jgi:hypothetical protein
MPLLESGLGQGPKQEQHENGHCCLQSWIYIYDYAYLVQYEWQTTNVKVGYMVLQ